MTEMVDSLRELDCILAECRRNVEQAMAARMQKVRQNNCLSGEIIADAMEYSLAAGGKRLRPALALMTADMLGVQADQILPYACAL
ncbi:MAG TPA: hypothetical protein DD727_04990, partial [Clostridiales bacterium]|nr:hypothetical protein [Clostridiales bacterium]